MPGLQLRQLHSAGLLILLGGGTAGIICACAYLITWVLGYSAASLDRSEFAAERGLLHAAISSYQVSLAKSISDVASWTELYRNFEGPPDARWEAQNLGPYLAPHFDIDEVLVTAKSGALVYRYSRTKSTSAIMSRSDRGALQQLTNAAFRAEKPNSQAPVSGVIDLNGFPCIAVAATIRPSSLNGVSHFSLIELRYLSASFLEKFGRYYGIARLRAQPARDEGLALVAPDRRDSRYELTWHPVHPGQALLNRASPTISAVALATTIALMGLLAVLWSTARRLRSGEERALRAELEASNIRASIAEETNRSKTAFIANISHELRTPLNAIMGLSQMISAELFGPVGAPKYLEYVKDIYKSSGHLLNLVNDILQLATFDTGKDYPRLKPLNLSRVVDESIRAIADEADRQKLHIDLRIDRQAEVLADHESLLQILTNILSNSVKFSFDGGLIVVKTSFEGDFCEVEIEDRGCGMPPSTLQELGKPFVHTESVYSRRFQGAGLGFAICFRLVQTMGATLKIESEVGAGTMVKLRLKRPVHYVMIADSRDAA